MDENHAPVVLIGIGIGVGDLVCGLFPTEEAAREAIHFGLAPSGYQYSIMTPPMNGVIRPSVWRSTHAART